MKIWVDDIRPAPEGYIHFETVVDTISYISGHVSDIELPFPVRIHSMNPVGAANMRRIIMKNEWKEV